MTALVALALLAAEAPQFNRDVRPILSDRCYACHGPDSGNRKADFRLDRDPGPAAIAKAIERVSSTHPVKRMPPAYLGHAPLKPAEIDVLKLWAAAGAKYETHWSFLPPKKASVPAGVHPIDHFVRERLKREGLSPSPMASPETLSRRVALDLTGLPPDTRDGESYEQFVDRLLSSKRYAERMTVRWLEAARYADTNGYQTDGERSMWRWRDWVLDAFDRNMPFDRFTVEQLAGDLLPNATRAQQIATGFHRNHRTTAEGGIIDEEFRVEYVADRAETTATVWLGLTAGCARCHDHKYDPISQREFYQLFAFFNQVPEKGFVYNFGNEEPYVLAPTPEQEAKLAALDAKAATAQRDWDRLAPKIAKASAKFAVPDGWLPMDDFVFRHAGGLFDGKGFIDTGLSKVALNYMDPFTFAATVKADEPSGAILSKSEDYWEGTGHGLYLVDGKLRLHIVFRWTDLGMRVETAKPFSLGESHRVVATYDGKRKPSGVHLYVDGVEQELKVLFNELSWPIESKEPFRIGAGGGKRFKGEIRDVAVWKRAISKDELDNWKREAWIDVAAKQEIRDTRESLRAAVRERDAYLKTVPTVMVMRDRPGIRKSYLLKRGAYDAPGEEVQPGTLAALPPMPADMPPNRLALARWLVSRDNPLTARVTVNRVWQMLFGTGLVKTVEDFGSQGEWPLHQELLDWLAVEFMESGWDIKKLLKTIVTSETYRQSGRMTPELAQRDPENRLLARGPRTRLAPEMIRDQALAASGLLVEKFGGPSVKPPQPPGLWQELAGGSGYKADEGEGRYRRSVYTYWRRTIQPPSMITFDSPTRETCVVRETRTNTPLQALNLMNDEAYVEAARKLAERMSASPDPISRGYELVLSRAPRAEERAVLEDAWAKLGPAQTASLILNLDEAVTKP
ncbi:MAG: DUF1553 domain-containing protein [Bryobacteraceae bacterium]|nr:DUF1553 domain-containing protein [Bryobacteraceae bacterium]